MATTRQNKVARLLQQDIGEILRKEAVNWFRGAMLSVTIVRIAPDLSFAKVYVSIFAPQADDTNQIFESLQKQSGKLRMILAKKVGKQLRIVPQLAFFIDDSLDYEKNINDLLQ